MLYITNKMLLPDQQIKKFQELYFEEFGEEISFEEAKEKAIELVYLYKAIYLSEIN